MPWFAALFCFVIGFVTSFWQSPFNVAPRTTLYFDSGHYLDSCRCLTTTVEQLYTGTANDQTVAGLANTLMLDGPILPLAGSIAFALAGQTPESAYGFTLVIMQCFFHGIAAALTCLITIGLSKNRLSGIAAGLLWALYPTAIAATNSFLTEPLAATLFLAMIFLLSTLFTSEKIWLRSARAVLAGLTSGLLILLKPALLPIIVLVNLTAQIIGQKKQRSLSLILQIGLGLGLALAPWLLFTKYATGNFHLLPSRRPVYNIVSGCNLETDGWGTYPDHPLISLFSENDSALHVASGMLSRDPAEAAGLLLRKSTRFWAAPWNDYRYKIFNLSYKIQSFLHCLLLLLGFYSILFFAAKFFSDTLDHKQKFLASACLIGIFGHAVYILFEGIPRYFFTAVPLLIVLALSLVNELSQKRLSLFKLIPALAINLFFLLCLQFDLLPLLSFLKCSTAVCITLDCALKIFLGLAALSSTWLLLKTNEHKTILSAAFILAGLYLCSTLLAQNGQTYEWTCNLSGNQKAERNVLIKANQAKPDWVLLLVDGDSTVSNAAIQINGQTLKDKPLSIYQYCGQRYELQDFLNTLGLLLRKNPEDLPKWRAVKVPIDLLKIGSWNNISLSAAKGSSATVYGDYCSDKNQQRSIPNFAELSPGKLLSSGGERFESRIYHPEAALFSQAKSQLDGNAADLSDSFGLQTGDYRLFLVFGYNHKIAPTAKPAKTITPPAPPTWNPATNPVKFDLPIQAPFLNKPLLNICIKLLVCAPQGNGQVVIGGLISKEGQNGPGSILPGCPKLYAVGKEWQTLEFSTILPSNFLSPTKSHLLGEISSLGSPLKCQDLQVILSPEDGPQLENCSLKFF